MKLFCLLFIAFLSGCGTVETEVLECPGPTDNERTPEDIPYEAGIFTFTETIDDLLAQIAREEVAGFGGFYFDALGGSGYLNIYLLDPQLEDARKAQAALYKIYKADVFKDTPVRAVQGQYTYAELYDWHRQMGEYIGQVEEWNMTDISESDNRIILGISDLAATQRLEAALKKAGVPLDAVIIVEFGPVLLDPLIEC